MSAFGGKADMTVCGCLLSRSLLGVKRTSHFAAHMSAFDPKRTWGPHSASLKLDKAWSLGGAHATARVRHNSRRCSGGLAVRGTGPTARAYAAHRNTPARQRG